MKKTKVIFVLLIFILSLLLSSCETSVPYIGENGNWWIAGDDTGICATGPEGQKGDTGEKGEKGENGDVGANGEDGKSAYEIYCEKYGYTKSEEEWLKEIYDALSKIETEDIYEIASKSTVILEATNKSGEKFSTGSGFLISGDGLIATAHHVIEKAYGITVTLPSGEKTEIKNVVGFDADKDIALLRIETDEELSYLEAETEGVTPGEEAFSFGIPLGFLDGSFSSGVVASQIREQAIDESGDRTYRIVQFTAPISSGNSGGPLLNANGKVIGVITSKYVYGEALNLATYIEELESIDTEYERSVAEFYKDTVYYQIKFNENSLDESESNGGTDTANPIKNGDTVYGTCSYNDYDIYTFTASGTESIHITLAYISASDISVLIAGEDLKVLNVEWTSSVYNGYYLSYANLTLAPGTYYIQAIGNSFYQNSYGVYLYWKTETEYAAFPYEFTATDFLQ